MLLTVNSAAAARASAAAARASAAAARASAAAARASAAAARTSSITVRTRNLIRRPSSGVLRTQLTLFANFQPFEQVFGHQRHYCFEMVFYLLVFMPIGAMRSDSIPNVG
ncbi:hypothetical protein [Paenibacillus sp. FSL L8-0506]|uniref:hypothetical protein n=1 Tax=Paenibacillus sp. FSL L8-0506 TaxID=2975335 RepID=UPI0030FAA876